MRIVRRRKVKSNALNVVPDVQLDLHLSSIASVRHAVETACLDAGTTFNSMGNYDYNAFYAPLMNIADQMKAVTWAVDRWAFRAKYMQTLDVELSHIYMNETSSNSPRFAKISRRLRICSPYDTSYRRVFDGVIGRLDMLAEAGGNLINFINMICAEGNLLRFDNPVHRGPEDHKVTNNDESCSSVTNSIPETELSSSRDNECSSVPLTPSAPRPHRTTPLWKLSLSHKYPIEKLYVGTAELQVFARTLNHARFARSEVIKTRKCTRALADLADDMQSVFDMWAERCDMRDLERTGAAEPVECDDEIIGERGHARK